MSYLYKNIFHDVLERILEAYFVHSYMLVVYTTLFLKKMELCYWNQSRFQAFEAKMIFQNCLNCSKWNATVSTSSVIVERRSLITRSVIFCMCFLSVDVNGRPGRSMPLTLSLPCLRYLYHLYTFLSGEVCLANVFYSIRKVFAPEISFVFIWNHCLTFPKTIVSWKLMNDIEF